MEEDYLRILGIDIGGTKIASAVTIQDGIVSQVITEKTPESALEIVEIILEQIDQHRLVNEFNAVGISTAGVVNTETGAVIGSTGNLPEHYPHINLKQVIQHQTGFYVCVENDANAAAYAECAYGAGRDMNNFIMLTLGTGVGGGIIIDRKLYKGYNYYAAECGHVIIDYQNGRTCTCGQSGCFEAYASGPGLLKTAQEIWNQHNVQFETSPSTYILMDLYQAGDPLAQKIIEVWYRHLAVGIASLTNVLAPEACILGGSMAGFIDYDLLNELVHQYTLGEVQVIPAKFKNHAGIIGATALANEFRLKSTVDI